MEGGSSSSDGDRTLSDEERLEKSLKAKDQGNKHYQAGQYDQAIDFYSQAIDLLAPPNWQFERTAQPPASDDPPSSAENSTETSESASNGPKRRETNPPKPLPLSQRVPQAFHSNLAIYFGNRAACHAAQGKWELTAEDCSHAIDFNPEYAKAIHRRAKAFEMTDKLEESLRDYKRLLELEPSNKAASEAALQLPPKIEEKQERLKQEMMGQLKEVGNRFLGMFGLSTDNFQMVQNESGGYSVNFKK